MPCDSQRNPNQSLQQRIEEIRAAVAGLDRALGRRQVKVVVGPQGAITFTGWQDRRGMTDACAYRRLMVSGSALAKMEITRAEQMAGRAVDRRVLVQGVHSHDGGASWQERG